MFADFQDRVTLITGPAKGMGAAITRGFAEGGSHLVLLGRDLEAIGPVAEAARALGRDALVARCDVTRADEVDAAVGAGLRHFGGRIDILVNVAGGTGPLETTAWETEPEAFDDIVALNMKGCYLTMRAVLPAMIARRYGKIVNVGGTFGLRGRAGRMAYAASKWGLRGITKSTALEVGIHNINVNCVCPGMVDGPRFERVCRERAHVLGIAPEEVRRRHEEEYALRRVSTDVDIADAVLFLASDRARNITGQDLAVDGGWVI